MRGIKNMSSKGHLCMLRQRSVKDASYTITRPGTVSYSVRHDDEDYGLSTGEGLRTFRWNVVLSTWAVGPEMKVNWPFDRAKRPRWLESSPTPLWEFHNRCPETSVRNYQSMLRKVPKERRSHLHRVQSLKSRNCGSATFSAISMPRE